MRRRRGAIVLAASALAHLGLLAAWMSTRPEIKLAESPVMEVQLVRLPHATPPPKPRPAAPALVPHHAQAAQPPPPIAPLVLPQPPPTTPAPRALTDEELLAGARPTPQQLRDGPIRGGRVAAGPGKRRPCNPDDHPGESDAPCFTMKDPGFAFEGHRKEVIRSYKDTTRTDDYPGLRCVFLHRHC